MFDDTRRTKLSAGNRTVGLSVRFCEERAYITYRGNLDDMVTIGVMTPAMREAVHTRLPPANKNTRNGRWDDNGDRYRFTKIREGFGMIERYLRYEEPRLYDLPGMQKIFSAKGLRTLPTSNDHPAADHGNVVQLRRRAPTLRLVWSNPAM